MQLATARTVRFVLSAALCAAVLARPSPARPCTAFLMEQEGGLYLGKSYDWHTSYGLVIVNKRGVAKRALVLSGDDIPAEWTSVHASVTFNQYGCEFPNGGMNDAGLAVEIAWLDGTEYPAMDSRPMVNELQWIQYALDNFSSVAELAAAAPGLRVSPAYADVHYLACDRTGACAAFEHLDGQLVVTQGNDLVVNTLANDTYASSVGFLGEHEGFGGSQPIPTGSGSLARFVRASAMALAEATEPAPQPALAILESVSQGYYSVWNIVYDLDQGRAYFRTYAENSIKSVDLGAFDPDCTSDAMMLDIDFQATGDVTGSFVPYTYEANTDLVDKSFAPIIDYVPPGTPEIAALYPDAQRCVLPLDDDDPIAEPGGGCTVTSRRDLPGPGLIWLCVGVVACALVLRRRSRSSR